MTTINRKQAIRNILIFTLLVNGLAWLGPVLGGDPTTPGPGFVVWGIAPLVSALVTKFAMRDPVSLGFKPAFKGNGRWYALSILAYPVSIAIVLATQSRGICLVHDWMYESRMFFVDKLVRMGAGITMCDPHRVLVEGPRSLRGIPLESPDIQAGMAMLVAGLVARGRTLIDRAEVVERGYERVVERLSALGADIRLV